MHCLSSLELLIDAQYKIIKRLQNELGSFSETELRSAIVNAESASILRSMNEAIAAAIAGLADLEKASGNYQTRQIEVEKHSKKWF